MRRMLVVGCGGSGGATLAYMMDQLRAHLADNGIRKMPDGWQFVHIDVPVSAPPGPETLGNVREQGGRYLGIGPQNGRYTVLDNAVSTTLAHTKRLDLIATWAPENPAEVGVPLSQGAGQYRALGRMVTLSKAAVVKEVLEEAWKKLFHANTIHEMSSIQLPGAGKYLPDEKPIILVVSSMAGGAGASMALDVCRILTLVQGVQPKLMGIFMVTPDIFDNIERDATPGVRPNALAMLGEIVASQTGSAHSHDVAAMTAAGQQNGEGERIPFARVFPVSMYLGVERTQLGDGKPAAVYRSLGRGLAALTSTEKALQDFTEYDLTNTQGLPGVRDYLGWGNTPWDTLPWGSFGFASLSMGRDRYAEYAAQRLARSSADRLLKAHLQDGNPANPDDQIRAALDSQWSNILQGIGLPDIRSADAGAPGGASNAVISWLTGYLLPRNVAEGLAYQVVASDLQPYLPTDRQLGAPTFVAAVNNALHSRRSALGNTANNVAYAWSFDWNQNFVARIEQQVAHAIATIGLPYATALIERLIAYTDTIAKHALEASTNVPPDIAALPPDVVAMMARLKGVLANIDAIQQNILNGSMATVRTYLYARICHHLAGALKAMTDEVLNPMRRGLDESHKQLRISAAARATDDRGLARVETDLYVLWPAESDHKVGDRWAEATNEVMLTSSTEFKALYESHLPPAAGIDTVDAQSLRRAVTAASQSVVTGLWNVVDGSRAPGAETPLLERTAEWLSSHFPRDPATGEPLVARPAAYDAHVRPGELLDRARAYIRRADSTFQRYCSVSLRTYLQTGKPSEIADNTRDLVEKFKHTLVLARPLASVNAEAVEILHNHAPQFKYKFSAIPFEDLPVRESLVRIVDAMPNLTFATRSLLEDAMSDEDGIKRIDVFGSFPNYSPLAFTSVIEPAREQWTSQSAPQQRLEFWKWRRTRPLPASLPMHVDERRRMVGGWLLGRLVGMVFVPSRPFTDPVQVWSEQGARWVSFPNPLLTPPSKFKAEYEWLPAILESVMIAIARSHERPVFDSLLPYRTLRGIYDDAPEEPTTGLMPLHCEDILTEWLRSGQCGSGEPSCMPSAASATTIDERAAVAKDWFTRQAGFVSTDFMGPGESAQPGRRGSAGGGRFSEITKREQASMTPLYRDIAPDIFWAANDLLARVDKCAADAVQRAQYGTPKRSGGPGYSDNTQGPEDYSPPEIGVF